MTFPTTEEQYAYFDVLQTGIFYEFPSYHSCNQLAKVVSVVVKVARQGQDGLNFGVRNNPAVVLYLATQCLYYQELYYSIALVTENVDQLFSL